MQGLVGSICDPLFGCRGNLEYLGTVTLQRTLRMTLQEKCRDQSPVDCIYAGIEHIWTSRLIPTLPHLLVSKLVFPLLTQSKRKNNL